MNVLLLIMSIKRGNLFSGYIKIIIHWKISILGGRREGRGRKREREKERERERER